MTAVLLVRLSAMGDLVQALGAIAALHRARPDWRLTVATQTPFLPLLEGVPGIARVVPFERRGGLRAVATLRTELQRERYDVALDLQGNWKSAFVARLSGARRCLGAVPRQEPRSRWLLHERIQGPPSRHPALVAHTLVSALVPGLPFTAPRLCATAAERERERAALRALGIDPERPFAVVVGTDPRDPRALRPASIAAELAAAPQGLLLLGPAEADLPTQPGTVVLRHGRGELRRLVALGALVAAAGGEVLGPDQGASHVLAASGARTRVCFGAQDPTATAPPAAVALVHPSPPPCQPCRARTCRHPEGPVCMLFVARDGRTVSTGLPHATS